MNRLAGSLALLGFLLSLAAHVAALAGVDVMGRVPQVWGLHVGIFVVFLPFVMSSRKLVGRRPSLATLRPLFPTWVLVIGGAVGAYAVLNFALFIAGTQGGTPEIRGEHFVLQNHGRLVRELSAAEYTALRANVVRGFSGHWLAFYFVPFAWFLLRKPLPAPVPRDPVSRP
jgi:hypothetical protein